MAILCWPQVPEPDGAGLRRGTLPEHWATGGPDCAGLAPFQIHEYNPDFYILRESGCTHFEKPFVFLLFGEKRALLLDTGAGKAQTGAAIMGVIDQWAKRHGSSGIELVVAHTHSHSDHTAGDAQFAGKARVTMVPLTIPATQAFFGITTWPEGAGSLDLGGRIIQVIPIPGHDKLSLAYYDPQTGVLLMGDTLYPGRLYVEDFPAYGKSIQRIVEFTEGKPIAHILGNHIEQTSTPFLDYKVGTKYQPEEHALELSRGTLLELNLAVEGMRDHPVRKAYRDFTIWPVPPR